MSFSYPQQPAPPGGGQGLPGASPQGWQPVPPAPPPPPTPPAPMASMSPPQPTPVAPQDKGDTEGLALLTVAIIFHILFNVYWLHADNHLIHLDEAHHMNRAIAYYDAIFPADQTALFERGVAALNVESPYPPLTHLVGALFIRVLGYAPDSIAFAGSLFLTLFLIGVYLFARQGMAARNAFLAALVAGFMPMAFAASRYFMPDLLLAALVAWALYALLKSDRFRKTGWVVLFALFTGLAFLTKQTAIIYLLLPALWIFGWGAFSTVYPGKGPGVPLRRNRAAHLLFNTLLCIFIVLGVCSWWYTRHVEYMYTWWSTQRGGEVGILQPGIASRIEFAMPRVLEDGAPRIYLDPAISRLTVSEKKEAEIVKKDENTSPQPPEKPENIETVLVEGEAAEEGEPIPPESSEGESVTQKTEVTISEGENVSSAVTEDAGEEGEGEEEGVADTEVDEEEETAASLESLPEPSPETVETDKSPAYSDTSLTEPFRQYWDVYPLYFINEIAFLPVVLVALLGLPALLLKRNRNAMALLLLVWVVGAYLLLTGVFYLRGPILLYACAPPAAVLCTFALDAVPRYRLRRALWGVLLFFLALQYVNLTLFSFGPLGRAEIPVLTDNPAVVEQHDQGLAVYKDQVHLGHYLLHPPEREEAITAVLFEKMLAYEKNRKAPAGPVAWYQVVSETPAHLSLDFYARHYQQMTAAGNTEEETKPIRPFAAVKWESHAPKDTLPELAETEYVVLKQDAGSEAVVRLEDWATFFSLHGFESIYNGDFNGYGLSLPGYVHVMAHYDMPSLEDKPDIFQTYDLLAQDGTTLLLSAEERKSAEQRYTRLLQEYTHIQPLNERVNLLGFHVKSTPENWHVLRLIVQATDVVSGEARIWLRATVHPEDKDRQVESLQGKESLIWDFDPEPDASTWKPNQAFVLRRTVMAAPLRYKLEIGIYEAGETVPATGTVETDWVDFSAEH